MTWFGWYGDISNHLTEAFVLTRRKLLDLAARGLVMAGPAGAQRRTPYPSSAVPPSWSPWRTCSRSAYRIDVRGRAESAHDREFCHQYHLYDQDNCPLIQRTEHPAASPRPAAIDRPKIYGRAGAASCRDGMDNYAPESTRRGPMESRQDSVCRRLVGDSGVRCMPQCGSCPEEPRNSPWNV